MQYLNAVFENIALYIYIEKRSVTNERWISFFRKEYQCVCQDSLETVFELRIS